MSEHVQGHVIVCWPSDRKQIAYLSGKGQVDMFVPTVEHTLTTCDSCGQSVWIGNPQLELLRFALLPKSRKLCIICAAQVQKTLNLHPEAIDVGISLRDAQRRT